MALLINAGDYNMPTLSGMVMDLTYGHDFPLDLYVFGLGGKERSIYLDPIIPQVEKIAEFLSPKLGDIRIYLELPSKPRIRPAVGIPREMREHETLPFCARVCAFLLYCMHDTVLLEGEVMDRMFYNI